MRRDLADKGGGGACRQAAAHGLHRAADVIDELGAGAHQAVAGAELGEIDLGLSAAVADRLEERRIEAPQPGQGLSIDAVALPLAGVDEPELAGIRDEDLVTQPGEQSAHPGRVGADLEHHASRCPAGELALKGGQGGPHPPGRLDLAVRIDGTVAAAGIAEIETDC